MFIELPIVPAAVIGRMPAIRALINRQHIVSILQAGDAETNILTIPGVVYTVPLAYSEVYDALMPEEV